MVLEPGATLAAAKMGGVIQHRLTYVGPIGPNGEDVINNTPDRGVHLDHYANIRAKGACWVAEPAPATWWERNNVVKRALSRIGTPWDIFRNNCERTATYARTGKSFSPQVIFWSLVALCLVFLLIRRRG